MATVKLVLLDGEKTPSTKQINKWLKKNHDRLVERVNKGLKNERKIVEIIEIIKLEKNRFYIQFSFDGLHTDSDAYVAAQDMWSNGMRLGFNMVMLLHPIRKKYDMKFDWE